MLGTGQSQLTGARGSADSLDRAVIGSVAARRLPLRWSSWTCRLFGRLALVRAVWVVIASSVVVLWLVPEAGAAVSFAPPTMYAAAGPKGVVTADFNADGNPDLAASAGGELTVWLGHGDGSFGAPTAYGGVGGGCGTTACPTAIGDFNADGDPDLVFASYSSNSVVVFLGGPGGSFRAPVAYAAGSRPETVGVGDFNRDGHPDLAVTTFGPTVTVLLGRADGSFGRPTSYPLGGPAFGIGARAIAVADFNGDGHPDVAVDAGNDILVAVGGAGGSFQPVAAIPIGELSAIAAADFNHDGHPDLAAVTINPNSQLSVLFGGAGASFGAPTNYQILYSALSIAVGDFNRDGSPDLAIPVEFDTVPGPQPQGAVRILLGGTDGGFGPSTPFTTGNQPNSVAVGDFNRDGAPDVATTNSVPDSVAVLMNSGVALDPGSIAFPPTAAGDQSGEHTVVVTNNRNVPLSIGAVTIAGPDASAFAASGDTCSGATVAPRLTCSVMVRFQPDSLATRNASLQFKDDAPGGQQSVDLSGTGAMPVTVSPAQISFADTAAGDRTAPTTVTLTNNTSATLAVSGVALAGADPSSFVFANNTCKGATLAQTETCSVAVRFRPDAAGARTASLQFTDSDVTSPQSVALSGTGTPAVALSPTSIAFSARPDHTDSGRVIVTLTNIARTNLTVSGVALAGPDATSFLFGGDTCTGHTLALGQACTVFARFRPLGTGDKTASMQFSDSNVTSPQSVPLSGTGTPGPWLGLSAQALKFGKWKVTTTAPAQTLTLTNVGSAPMSISAIAIEGTNPGDFTGLTETCTGMSSLAAGASCTASVAFEPTATGTRTATMTITDTAPRNPHHVPLQGTGT